MAARHRVRFKSIQIIRVSQIEPKDVRRPYITQILAKNLKFPNLSRTFKPASKSYRKTLAPSRPKLF